MHQQSLDIASAGLYTHEFLQGLSEERRARYFLKEDKGYRIVPGLRQMIVFARHDLTRDAPFTKLDLITCRNLLIYFESHMQQQVLRRFHFALTLGGLLFLGPSESLGELTSAFSEMDKHWKMYKKEQEDRRPVDLGVVAP